MKKMEIQGKVKMNENKKKNTGEQKVRAEKKHEMNDKHKKAVSIIAIIIFLVFSALAAWFIGKPMVQFVSEPDKFRAWVQSHGMWSWLVCIGMMVLQIIVAIIPGGPLEIGAGYAFGPVVGSVLCIVGSIIGCTLVFQFVRVFGIKLIEAFFSIEKIRSLKFLHDERKRNILAFVIFALPGTPKDLLSYFMGLTDIKLSTWLLISTIARIPAIIVSAMGGDALGSQKYVMAIIVFVVTLVISAIGMYVYKKICKVQDERNIVKNRVNEK